MKSLGTNYPFIVFNLRSKTFFSEISKCIVGIEEM